MSAIALSNAPAHDGRGSFHRRSDHHVDVKLVVDEGSSGSAANTIVIVTKYPKGDNANAPGSRPPKDSFENRAASSRCSREDAGFSHRGSARSWKTEVEEDDVIGAGANSANDEEASHPKLREESPEEEKGLSLAKRKALRRRKAREEVRKNGSSDHAAQGRENDDA